MGRRYLRAHPESELGKNFTEAERMGWKLVAFNGKGMPIFRQTLKSWIGETFFRQKVYGKD